MWLADLAFSFLLLFADLADYGADRLKKAHDAQPIEAPAAHVSPDTLTPELSLLYP